MSMTVCNSHRSKRSGWFMLRLLLWACHLRVAVCLGATDEATEVSIGRVLTRENATIVTTADGLYQAVHRGDAHIELQDHIFFTAPQLNFLGTIPDTVKSIRGNCTHLPKGKGWAWRHSMAGEQRGQSVNAHIPDTQLQKERYAAPKRPLVPRQCVIATSRGLMVVVGRLWLDGVYIRRRSNHLATVGTKFTAIHVTGAGQLWATDVTIQGDKRASTEALKVESKAFCHRTLIADHRGSGFSSPVNVMLGATVSLMDTTITGTKSSVGTGLTDVEKIYTGATIRAYTASKVRLQGCSLEENDVRHELETVHDGTVAAETDNTADVLEAQFYSDMPNKVWWNQEKTLVPPHPLELPPIPRLVPPSNNSTPAAHPGDSAATSRHARALVTALSQDLTDASRQQTQLQFQDLELLQLEQQQVTRLSCAQESGLKVPVKDAPEEVSTQEELYHAIWRGTEHILLLKHLDLTDVQSPAALSVIPDTVQSIRGNCTCLPDPEFAWSLSEKDGPCSGYVDPATPGSAGALPLKPRQCVIEVQQGGLHVVGRLLLEGIYFKRVPREEMKTVPSTLIQVHGAGELYMKDVTLQGGGHAATDTQAIYARSKAHGQGLVVADVDGASSAMAVGMGGTLSLNDSCMHHTEVVGQYAGLVLVEEQGKLLLQSFTMHSNEAPEAQQVFVEHAASDGTFMYSDKVRTFCGMDERGCVALPMNPVQAVPPETAFLSPSDTWVVLIEEALVPIDRGSEPQCDEGDFIEKAVLHLFAWLATLSLPEGLSLALAAIGSLLCCFTINGCFSSGSEARPQERNNRDTAISRWKRAGWVIASRFRGLLLPLRRRIPGLSNQRDGPEIEEVGGPGRGAIMPPERVHTDDLVAPPPLSEVLAPGAKQPNAHNTAGEGADGAEDVEGEDAGSDDEVEVIDISADGGAGVLNPRVDEPLSAGSERRDDDEPSVLKTSWF